MRLAWLLWGLVIMAAIALVVSVSGCVSSVPYCPSWQYEVGHDEDGRELMALDQENAMKLRALILGLAAGTCRLRPSGSTDI